MRMEEQGFKRKLTAILSADAVGYSRLMGDDEEATIRTLIEYRDAITDLVKQHKGRVVDSPGDNVLAEFARDFIARSQIFLTEFRSRGYPLNQIREGLPPAIPCPVAASTCACNDAVN